MMNLSLEDLNSGLTRAAEFYCQGLVVTPKKNIVRLPMLFQWYERDFGPTHDDMLAWIRNYLSGSQRRNITHMLETGDYVIEWYYDWTPEPKPFIGGQ